MSKVWEYFKEVFVTQRCPECREIKCICFELEQLEHAQHCIIDEIEGGYR